MMTFLRKLLRPEKSSQVSEEDADLERFFTDSEHARHVFEQMVLSARPSKRLLVIHGVGGMGKSTLLKINRLFCRRRRMAVALAGGEEAHSPVDVLVDWAKDLSEGGIGLDSFQNTLIHYRSLQTKVDSEAKKANQSMSQAAEKLSKIAAKTFVEMAASSIPVFGPLASALGGASAEAVMDWLHGFLSKSDLQLFLDPTERLTNDFFADLLRGANQRVVLMLDTYEQIITLDDWLRVSAQRMPKAAIMVIAGRVFPNWERSWPGWIARAEIVELKAMESEDLRTLVRRYYALIHGGEPPMQQVEAIVQFARGLPMVATTVVQLWVQHGVEDFQMVRTQVVADLVDRLLEGVPQDTRPGFEVAAILRRFDADVLGALMLAGDSNSLYLELRRWPFIRPQRDGLAVHDTMREMINEALRTRSPDRFHTLHLHAAAYYEARLQILKGDERERSARERLYHSFRADEGEGMSLFQGMAEDLVRYGLLNQLRSLLNDVSSYSLQESNSNLWREYYIARLAHLEGRLTSAESAYQSIANNEKAEPKLRAYCLCDLGQLWNRHERLDQSGAEIARNLLERSIRALPQLDSKLAFALSHLRWLYCFRSEWVQGVRLLERQLRFFREHSDNYGVVYSLAALKQTYGLMGNWGKAYAALNEGLEILDSMPPSRFFRANLLGFAPWTSIWSGRYSEAERYVRDAQDLVGPKGDVELGASLSKDLGLVLGLQGKYQEAGLCFTRAIEVYESLGQDFFGGVGAVLGFSGKVLIQKGELQLAQQHLERSLSIKQKLKDTIGIPEILNWFGELHEIRSWQTNREVELKKAEEYYLRCLSDYGSTGRAQFECGAWAGLARINYAVGDLHSFEDSFAKAHQFAKDYEYNDYSAWLYLSQGHASWNSKVPNWGRGFEASLHHYQNALIYALRYNRFLLDAVLSGGGVTTSLQPIIKQCLLRGDEGKHLLTMLRDWWKTGINSAGSSRSDSISPIPEDIALIDAERIARERELGDGLPQLTIKEQIEAVL